MGRHCGFSVLDFRSRFSWFSASIASLLVVLLTLSPTAWAKAKPLDAAKVHQRILRRGIDNQVGVETNNGVELVGRIIAINADSFTLQLFNDPEPVTIHYADVIDLRTGPSRAFWIATGVGIGVVAGMAIWGFEHVHNLDQQNKLPNMPPVPAVP